MDLVLDGQAAHIIIIFTKWSQLNFHFMNHDYDYNHDNLS